MKCHNLHRKEEHITLTFCDQQPSPHILNGSDTSCNRNSFDMVPTKLSTKKQQQQQGYNCIWPLSSPYLVFSMDRNLCLSFINCDPMNQLSLAEGLCNTHPLFKCSKLISLIYFLQYLC